MSKPQSLSRSWLGQLQFDGDQNSRVLLAGCIGALTLISNGLWNDRRQMSLFGSLIKSIASSNNRQCQLYCKKQHLLTMICLYYILLRCTLWQCPDLHSTFPSV